MRKIRELLLLGAGLLKTISKQLSTLLANFLVINEKLHTKFKNIKVSIFWTALVSLLLVQNNEMRNWLLCLCQKLAATIGWIFFFCVFFFFFFFFCDYAQTFRQKVLCYGYVKHTVPSSILNNFRAFPTSRTDTSTMGNLCGLVSLTWTTVVAHAGRSYWQSSEITSYLNFPRCLISKSFHDWRAIAFRWCFLRAWL